jgi:Tfp pilus assembly protein PilO
MPDKPKPTSPKKALVVPKTDVSQDDDKSTRRFVYYMIALIILIIIAGGALIYWLAGNFVTQTNKNKAQDKTIGLLEQKKRDLAELQPNYDKITAPGPNGKSQSASILSAQPENEAYKDLIAMVERMGQDSGVKIPSISKSSAAATTTTTDPTSAVIPYQISVSISGTFAQVEDFIKKTENSARVMDFVTLNIGGSTKSGPVTASATFTVYYQPPADISSTQKELE